MMDIFSQHDLINQIIDKVSSLTVQRWIWPLNEQ